MRIIIHLFQPDAPDPATIERGELVLSRASFICFMKWTRTHAHSATAVFVLAKNPFFGALAAAQPRRATIAGHPKAEHILMRI